MSLMGGRAKESFTEKVTLDPRSGGGEEISHAENIPGRVGRRCKGTSVRACLIVPVTAEASVD